MAGRRTYFSFQRDRDLWRASTVRKAGVVDARTAVGWTDVSGWEQAKKGGDDAIKRRINAGLGGTNLTVVLIGCQTATSRWVTYEIQKSLDKRNGLLGIYIHRLKNEDGKTDIKGSKPELLRDNNVPCHNWDRKRFGIWVERAAVKAGHCCMAHNNRCCSICS